jgi:hypothetical protein
MSDWLDTLDFLTPDQRKTLREHDLDAPAALRRLSAEQIAAHSGLSIGKAGRILDAAHDSAPAIATPTSFTLKLPEAVPHNEKVALALAAAAADPSKLPALLELGVTRVVVGTTEQPDGDTLNVTLTEAMLRHAEAGAPVGSTWQGLRIVMVRDVLAPELFCNPRTGKALQDGRDAVSLVPWADLGRDNLRLAAFGYSRGVFEGRPEDAVFKAVRDEAALRQRISVMAKAEKVDLASMDAVIVWRATSQPAAGPLRDGSPRPGRSSPMRGGNPHAQMTSLLLDCFSPSELRRFVRYLPGGVDLDGALPGATVSASELASATVDTLRRHGRINRDLRDRLRAERPRKADEIDAVFDAFGIA